MLRLALSVLLTCVACVFVYAQNVQQNLSLPTLHAIKEATLSPSYSCRPTAEASRGYENTALFLSDYTRRTNSPDLLFNGACGSTNYFQASTAGDDMALIADLGEGISLEEVSAHRVFNMRGVHLFDAYSKFADSVEVKLNHTYAVLLNKNNIRGLFVFTVVEYMPNKRVVLNYAVKSYQVMRAAAQSQGFEWEQKNSY